VLSDVRFRHGTGWRSGGAHTRTGGVAVDTGLVGTEVVSSTDLAGSAPRPLSRPSLAAVDSSFNALIFSFCFKRFPQAATRSSAWFASAVVTFTCCAGNDCALVISD
jgi:hypothetical protein